jgi:hypothetical protein
MPVLLKTAGHGYAKLEAKDQDRELHAMMLTLTILLHLHTTDFTRAIAEARELFNIRCKLSPHDDAKIARADTLMAIANASAGHYDVGLQWLLKVERLLKGPLGDNADVKITWELNASCNYYLMNEDDRADDLLSDVIEQAKRMNSWYIQTA